MDQLLQNLLNVNAIAKGSQASEAQLLRTLFQQWAWGTTVIKNSIREVEDNVISELENNDKRLQIPTNSSQTPLQLELGDQVKIVLKQRQFKQVDVSQSGWNNLMKLDTNKVGRVVGIQTYDEFQVTVFYPGSNRLWSINSLALEKVSDIDDEDLFGQQSSYSGFKIGDDVTVDEHLPTSEIRIMQRIIGLPDQAVIQYRDSLLKILAFDCKGYAIVSIDQYKSVMIHSGLLKRRNNPVITMKTLAQEDLAERYPIGKEIKLMRYINILIYSSLWRFEITKALGKRGKICYHGANGEIGVRIDNTAYLITEQFIDHGWEKKGGSGRKRSNGHGYETSDTFPFRIGDKLTFRIVRDKQCIRLLKDNGIPVGYLQVLKDEICVFIGYDRLNSAVVDLRWPDIISGQTNQKFQLILPCQLLEPAPPDVANTHNKFLKGVSAIKVGDRVSIIGSKYATLIKEHLRQNSVVSNDVTMALTSNAELVAFDDDNDEAILRYDNGKLYACLASYISLPLSLSSQNANMEQQAVMTTDSQAISHEKDDVIIDGAALVERVDDQVITPQDTDISRKVLASYDDNKVETQSHVTSQATNDTKETGHDIAMTSGQCSHSGSAAVTPAPVPFGSTAVSTDHDQGSLQGDAIEEPGDTDVNDTASEISEVGQRLQGSEDVIRGEATGHRANSQEVFPQTIERGNQTIRKQAELTYDPQTKEIVLRGNLEQPQPTAQPLSPILPTTTGQSTPMDNSGMFGGTQKNYNIRNCNFHGPTYIGSSSSQQQTDITQGRPAEQ